MSTLVRVFLRKVGPANYFHSLGERWGVLLPSATLQVWGRSIVLLICTPATSSTEPPSWTQTVLNWCVEHVLCSKGLSTPHPFLIDITDPHMAPHMSMVAIRTLCHTWDSLVVFVPGQIFRASRLSFQCWFFWTDLPSSISSVLDLSRLSRARC